MKKIIPSLFGLIACLSLSGCGLMEDAFKAGFIIAAIIAVIIGILIWVLHMGWRLFAKYFPSVTMRFEGFWDE